jgi:protein gp37
MGGKSSIEWTEATWNPVAGCTVLSPGCTNCYAMRMAARLALMGRNKYVGTTRKSGGRSKWNGKVILDSASLEAPLQWKVGRLIFINSMSDLFHDEVPGEFIEKVFSVAATTPQHTYQVLTKRAERLMTLGQTLSWPENLWMGVSVENADYTWRIECLRKTPAKVRFLSLEPLLGPLGDLDLHNIDWVIVGGESGPGARPMDEQWVRSILDQCRRLKVPFHFKQWGGANKKKAGRVIDGRTWDEMPARAFGK